MPLALPAAVPGYHCVGCCIFMVAVNVWIADQPFDLKRGMQRAVVT